MDQIILVQKSFEKDLKYSIESKERNDIILHLTNASKHLLIIQKEIDGVLKKNIEIKISIISEEVINYLNKFKNTHNLRFEINFSLNKIFDILFNISYYKFICNLEEEKIIIFINTVIKLIENIRGVLIYQLIIRKIHLYMNYISQNYKQLRKIINELINGYYIPHSNQYRSFNEILTKKNIIPLVSSNIFQEKEEGITLLIEFISRTSFPEQFELLYLNGPDILTNLLKEPKEEFRNSYIKFGNLLLTLCYSIKYKIITKNEKENDNIENNIIYILNNKFIKQEKEFDFLNNKTYELTFQKEILELNKNIIEICLIYINTIIKFEKIFQLQNICYLLLRRIYFNFPNYKKEIEQNILLVLTNLSNFTGQNEWNITLDSREFSYYLLGNDKELGKKIKSSIVVSQYDFKYEKFILNKTNLTIGFSNIILIEAGKKIEKKIEVLDEESLVYISIGLDYDDYNDIAIQIFKYNSDLTKWNIIYQNDDFKFENNNRKIIIFSQQPSLYKIVFDNRSSWINKKTILYRFVFLKPIIN